MERARRKQCFGKLSVEPSLLLLAYALAVSDAPFQDLLLKRICQVTPEIPHHWCESLPSHPTAEGRVHPKAATLLMIASLMETVIPATMSCLAGAWSDRSGSRKPLVIIPLAGFTLKFAMLAVIMCIPTLPLEWFLLTTLPVIFSGGWPTYFGAVTSIVGDKTASDGNRRTYHLGMLQIVYNVGLTIGNLTASVTLQALGHIGVLLLSSGACFLALLITLFTVRETNGVSSGSGDNMTGRNVGNHETCLLKDVVQTISKKRANGGRICLLLSVSTLVSGIMAVNGERHLRYMFTRQEFGWSVMDYTLFRSIMNGLQMTGTLFIVSILSHRMNIADAPLAIFSYSGALIAAIIKAFATETRTMYIGGSISMFHAAGRPLMRSVISKCVPQNELGKVFTLTTSLEGLAPLAVLPLYTYVFSETIFSYPGAFFFLSALIFSIDVAFCCIIHGTNLWHSRSEQEPLLTRDDSTCVVST